MVVLALVLDIIRFWPRSTVGLALHELLDTVRRKAFECPHLQDNNVVDTNLMLNKLDRAALLRTQFTCGQRTFTSPNRNIVLTLVVVLLAHVCALSIRLLIDKRVIKV